ncbi:hypothetical protein SUGI_0586940 [Cryptomeria japonica]|uniref:transcription factor MYB1 n=1 Tax=Cryptomeria japonica TaxID=3369 RepID=UPI0024149650|nr:transcription factor MYB1 [Cryptomeria japonica]GLJ29743.1 hypothetical protein SUGI_0586940 [Cryptomeria japonica]
MVRSPCCSKMGLNQGAWTAKEDLILSQYIKTHGNGGWRSLPKKAGLNRCGKSCRLRWLNYLRPDIKRGNISSDEEELIIRLHRLLGNRWSLIAGRLPGRTDNEIKNYWNTHLRKKHETAKKYENVKTAIRRGTVGSSGEDNDDIVKPKPVRGSQIAIPNHSVMNNCVNNGIPDYGSKSLCKLLLGDSDPSAFQLIQQNSEIFEGSNNNIAEDNSLNLNELPNTHCNMFSVPSDFRFEDYGEGMSEIYNGPQQIDWINELEYM